MAFDIKGLVDYRQDRVDHVLKEFAGEGRVPREAFMSSSVARGFIIAF